MGTYDVFKTDSALEEDGAEITLTDGSKWKLRRLSSKAGREAFQKAQRPFQGMLRSANIRALPIPPEIDRAIVRNALINGIVVGWEGVTDVDGNALSFTKENCEKVLTDLPDLAAEAFAAAGELANYRAATLSEAAKNS